MNKLCPRCRLSLTTVNLLKLYPTVPVRDMEVEICKSCEGIWLDSDEFSKVEQVVDPTFIEFKNIPDSQTQQVPLSCPKCENKVLLKIKSQRDQKVILDVCPDCKGIWLDQGELKAIQQENIYTLLFKAIGWITKVKSGNF